MPVGAFVLRSFSDPTKSIYVPHLKNGENTAEAKLDETPAVFVSTPGLAKIDGSVSFEVADLLR